jgi:hypothetical protein
MAESDAGNRGIMPGLYNRLDGVVLRRGHQEGAKGGGQQQNTPGFHQLFGFNGRENYKLKRYSNTFSIFE